MSSGSRKKFAILFIFAFVLTSSEANEAIENVDDTIKIPDDKKTCSCSWSQWMNSGPPTTKGEDETYTVLRNEGFEFCSSPVDIQCYNYDEDSLQVEFTTLCDVNIGLTCPFLCNDYGVRVACCYCPPEATGPEFQISSESDGGGCLRAVQNTSLLSVVDACDLNDAAQSWVWVSKYSLKNVELQQCLAVTDNTVVLENCELDAKRQKWEYINRSKTLQRYRTSPKSYLKKVNAGVSLDTSRGQDSLWRARVAEGKTSLKNMRNFPCEPLSTPGNGEMSCSLGQYVSSECTFSCEYGFRLPVGTENPSKCTDDGLFSADTPQCEKIECNPAVDSIEHGTVSCSNNNNLDSSCVYRCDAGYALIGTNQLICLDVGEWTDALPTCERVVCTPDLEKIGLSHGAVNCTDEAIFGSLCSYSCEGGYELVGSMLRSCQLDEKWDQSQPTCNKIQCPPARAAQNSRMSCTAASDYLSTCKFSCHTGYTMVGSATSICTADKTWGSEPPSCERKTCNALRDPENGNLFCDDSNFYYSKCSFTCDRGFEIKGKESLRCTDEGWNFDAPICEQIMCDQQTNPVNGAVSCSNDDIYGSTCSFSCLHGFALDGDESSKCVERGWDHPAPTCQQITCSGILNPTKGKVLCSKENFYGSTCHVLCDEGYHAPERSQHAPITCQLDGLWTSSVATCTRIQCRDINISRGVKTCTDLNFFDSTCTFHCKEGFTLFGAEQAKCTGFGWDAQAPSCDRLTCSPTLARPSKGQINCDSTGRTVCRFSCDPGHELIGSSVSECQKDKSWSVTEIPVCRVVKCLALPMPPLYGDVTCMRGTTFDSTCDFKCNVGYNLLGEQQTRCTERRTWDHETPTCQKVSCPELTAPFHGRMDCSDKFFYESKCTYKCDEGYQIVGQELVECLKEIVWSELSPYCKRIACNPSYSNPRNGEVSCSDTNKFNSECTFSCEEGFSLEGADTSVCESSGWTLATAPTCKQIECLEIPKPENGHVVCDKKSAYGSECRFLCDQGYARRPDTLSVKCMGNRRWNPAGFPVCEIANVTLKALQPATTTPTMTTTLKPRSTTRVVATTMTTTTATTATTATTTTTTTTTTTELPALNTTQSVPSKEERAAKATPKSQLLQSEIRTSPKFILTAAGPEVLTTLLPDDISRSDRNSAVDQEQGFPIAIVAAVGAVAFLVVVILIILLLYRRNKNKKYHDGPPSSFKINNRCDQTELGPLIPYGNGSAGSRKFLPVSMDRLEMEYNRRHADDDKLFREEYRSLTDTGGSKEAGGMAKNKDKNRYTNILPYDHSRVVLSKIGDADSDYINASFVDGYKHKGKFIAAQGPKTNTVCDFWRMIWEQNASTIIMATNLEERKEQKCAMYWPEIEGKQNYGNLVVTQLDENHLVDYTVRKFSIQRIGAQGDATLSLKRGVTQYHFTSWPDFGVPKSPSGILKFLRKIKQGSPTSCGPIVVHCSAGVGRTGTFIGIDAMLDMISSDAAIDVHRFCSQMRQQRPEMVQTEQQYIFIYQSILEHNLYGDTEVEASEVSSHIDELMQRLPGNVTGMEHEFKKLTSIRIQKEHMRAGNHPENMKKNRVLLILPYDWNRVILPIKRGQENTDYINASYIDGYRQKDAYIATQGPLPHTMEDFWRMVWSSRCASIVMLTELLERGQAKCALYWPTDEGSVSMFGDIEVELFSETANENYTERDFRVSNIGSTDQKQITVKQFHYHGWPEVGAPASGYGMIELVEAVQRQQQFSGNHPIVIHCSAGAGRTGAFCALSTALEQVKAEGVLDMFQIVKCLRMQRPHMVQNLEQYEFCYRAVQEYIDSMSAYCNFK